MVVPLMYSLIDIVHIYSVFSYSSIHLSTLASYIRIYYILHIYICHHSAIRHLVVIPPEEDRGTLIKMLFIK